MSFHKSKSVRTKIFQTRFLAILAAASLLFVVVPASANAAQPEAGYDTARIVSMVDTVVGDIPIRNGFWDHEKPNRYSNRGDIGEGFGFDKAWHKHRVTSLAVIQYVMSGNNVKPVGGNEETSDMYDQQDEGLNFYREVSTLTCPNTPDLGEVCVYANEPLDMVVAVNQEDKDLYYDWPAGSPVGLQTAYCDRDTYDYDPSKPDECPSWVNQAMSQGLIA
jgi:hypothetical protein